MGSQSRQVWRRGEFNLHLNGLIESLIAHAVYGVKGQIRVAMSILPRLEPRNGEC